MRGRPKKSMDDYRSDTLRIRLTESERTVLDQTGGGRTSTWAREVLLKAAKRHLRQQKPQSENAR